MPLQSGDVYNNDNKAVGYISKNGDIRDIYNMDNVSIAYIAPSGDIYNSDNKAVGYILGEMDPIFKAGAALLLLLLQK
ncbi:MAG: hypothetical protein HRT38_00005 [Alteromonadaceae bacterium]|nr:hypothetical protein [Alteromonadaceae bacterium]